MRDPPQGNKVEIVRGGPLASSFDLYIPTHTCTYMYVYSTLIRMHTRRESIHYSSIYPCIYSKVFHKPFPSTNYPQLLM